MEEVVREVVIPPDRLAAWQAVMNLAAQLIGVPAALIMRIDRSEIEVFIASQTEGNPYTADAREHLWGSGLYCETVIRSGERLLVPNALNDPAWRDNPDIALNMISYLGFPLLYPNGEPFGTVCVLDAVENPYDETRSSLLERMRDLVQSELALVYMNAVLHDDNRKLQDYIGEIKTLRGLIPICAWCKRLRDEQDYWQHLEEYLASRTDAVFTHSICPSCASKMTERSSRK